jgi:ammonium transporter, Amt family
MRSSLLGRMSRGHVKLGLIVGLVALGLLLVPSMAFGDNFTVNNLAADKNAELAQTVAINSVWVMFAALLVMFMQAGFAFLEIGFSRGKNVGTVVAKILVNFAIAGLAFWAVGFAISFGSGGDLIGQHGFFLHGDNAGTAFPLLYSNEGGIASITPETLFFFQFVFCAVSLAIVWGTTLERIKFGVYVIYAIIFAAILYPIGAHWIFGGGWLQANVGMQDFAGSTVVHLIGASGALAVLLLLGPRKGKYGPDKKPRAIPGHSMPLFGLGILILWLGWFGFNPGSTLGALDGRFTEVVVVTNLAAATGVLTATLTSRLVQKTIDIGMVGNGAIAALVAITAPSGYVEFWAAPIIGGIAGVIVVVSVILIDKFIDDPVGALSAHGVAGIWGTLSCGLFTSTRLAAYNGVGDPGLFYNGSFHQLGAQALGVVAAFSFVFSASFIVFFIIKKTYGLRVSEAEEEAGLDISEHGMYGYPEQFIPAPELVGYSPGGVPAAGRAGEPVATTKDEVTA